MPDTKRPTDNLGNAMPTKESGNIEPQISRLDREAVYGSEIDYEDNSAAKTKAFQSTDKSHISNDKKQGRSL